jgi:transposase-like protein
LIEVEVFRLLAETVCPRCLSGNIDDKFGYMGEYSCRHCGKFWKTT